MSKTIRALTAAAAAITLSGCIPTGTQTEPQQTQPAQTSAVTSERLIDTLVRQEETPRNGGYDRDNWSHWDDINNSGCTARQDVLATQILGLPQIDLYNPCKIVEGDWYSIYDEQHYSGHPSNLDMDHVVALAEAYDSGGKHWTATEKQVFANDPDNLIAVTASSNRQKSDKDAADWQPAPTAWCTYATTVVAVKAKYSLSVDNAEYEALNQMLKAC